MKRCVLLVLICAALGTTHCKCNDRKPTGGKTKPAGRPAWRKLLEMLPRSFDWMVMAGDAAGLLSGARGLLDTLSGTTVGIMAEELARLNLHKIDMRDINGFDPSAWKTRGIDLVRGAAVAVDGKGKALAFLGVAKKAQAKLVVERILKRVAGASTFKPSGERTLALRGGKVRAAYTFHKGYAVIAGPASSEKEAFSLLERVTGAGAPRLIQRPEFPLLAKGAGFGKGVTVIAFPTVLRRLGGGLSGLFGALRGFRARIEASKGGLNAELFFLTDKEYAQSVSKLLPKKASPSKLVALLTPDTVLALAGRIDLAALYSMVVNSVPQFREAIQAALSRLKNKLDVDVKKELLQNLTGEGVLAVHKIDANVVPLFFGAGTIAQILAIDPFQLSLLLKVRDPKLAYRFIRKIGILMDAPIERVGKREIVTIPLLKPAAGAAPAQPPPAVRMTVAGDTLLVTLGKGRLQQVLEAIRTKRGGFLAMVQDPETKKRLSGLPTPVLYLHGRTLEANLKEIEQVLIKRRKLLYSSLVQKVTELVAKIQDLTVSGSPEELGVRVWLRMRLK